MRHLFVTAVFCLTLSFSTAQAQNPAEKDVGIRSRFVLSDIDQKMVKEFNRAWQQCVLGTKSTEAVVLVLRDPDGSVKAVSAGRSNETYEFTFRWNPSIIAVFHTHPNNRPPQPVRQDILVARRFEVPIFTLTGRGMFMYDPATDRITQLKIGLDWLDFSRWPQAATLAAINAPQRSH